MSVVSPRHNIDGNESRFLLEKEKILLSFLLGVKQDFAIYLNQISSARVIDMLDGGMGSIKFTNSFERCFGRTLIEAEYLDIDDVMVNIAINLDEKGNLYEVDFWKYDFSPLRRYPCPELLNIKNIDS